MSAFRADPGALDALGSEVGRRAADLAGPVTGSLRVLLGQGYGTAAGSVEHVGAAAGTWARLWAASLAGRIAILDDATEIPTTVADRAEWLIQRARTLYFATPANAHNGKGGSLLAEALLDALEDGDLEAVRALMARLEGLSEAETVAFFERLDADMTGLIPTLLVDAGVADGDLAGYLAPLGAALAMATSAEDGMALSFTGAEIVSGHEGAAVSPAAYFDFGDFHPEFVFAAAAGVLAGYADTDLPLRSPQYERPDGSVAEPDPRLPLLREVLAMDEAGRLAFLAWVDAQGAMPGLVAPMTEWGDGGEAVGRLLADLAGSDPRASAGVVVLVMRAVAEARGLAPAIAFGAAAMVAPHLPSLVVETWFGEQLDLEPTPLRPALAATDDPAGLAERFMAAVLGSEAARSLIHGTFAVLLAATVSAHFDPNDSESLAGVADDLGTLWGMIFGARLQADLDEGRRLDENAAQAGSIAKTATNLVVAGGALNVASAGFGPWIAEQVSGLVDVAAPVESLLGGTAHGEQALIDGFGTMESSSTWVALILAAEMHHRGVLELPAHLLDLDPTQATDEDRRLLVVALTDAGVDVEAWFNDVFAIIAYGVPTPR